MVLPQHATGLGLRQPHYRELMQTSTAHWSPVTFLEVHSENFFAAGGASRQVLLRAREKFALSLHGVGLGLGNAQGLDAKHLHHLARLVSEIQPALVSEHVCWNTSGTVFNDLLPLPYTHESLRVLCDHVDQTQQYLKRQILVENATSYVQFVDDDFDEFAFIAELAQRTGCGILLDVNNLYVNSINLGTDIHHALNTLANLPAKTVQEIHLAGHLTTPQGLIDHHGSNVSEPVWQLYQDAIECLGATPTLIEWDTDIPPLNVLLSEAHRAQNFLLHA